MDILEKASYIAHQVHDGQSYGGIFPYIYHLDMCYEIAISLGCLDEEVLAAVKLHDALEDTDISYNDLKNNLTERVADLVYAVTDELGKNRKERKEKTLPKIKEAGYDAIFVKVVDRIANMEHSASSGHSMYKAYRSEYAKFVEALGLNNLENPPKYLEKSIERLKFVSEKG